MKSYVWNLEQGTCQSEVMLPTAHFISAEFVSVGHLYQVVLIQTHELAIVNVRRVGKDGALIDHAFVGERIEDRWTEFVQAYSCGDERWLSYLLVVLVCSI